MEESIKTNSYIAARIARYISIMTALTLLSGCLGGTVAQQIVRSIATSVADNAVANAMDVNEDAKPRTRPSITLADRPPSDLSLALMNSGFKERPSTNQLAPAQPIEKPIPIIKTNELVRVKVHNFIIGEEKNAIYEKAYRIGTANLPHQQAWKNWNVASGVIEKNQTPITFFIPPALGKLPSGSFSIVELAYDGNLNIARYADNQ